MTYYHLLLWLRSREKWEMTYPKCTVLDKPFEPVTPLQASMPKVEHGNFKPVISCSILIKVKRPLWSLAWATPFKAYSLCLSEVYLCFRISLGHRAHPCDIPGEHSFNSLWLNHTIWLQRMWSTLVQVMACCLTAPSHYLNWCWHIISKVHWH